jgi:hypothetical protein
VDPDLEDLNDPYTPDPEKPSDQILPVTLRQEKEPVSQITQATQATQTAQTALVSPAPTLPRQPVLPPSATPPEQRQTPRLDPLSQVQDSFASPSDYNAISQENERLRRLRDLAEQGKRPVAESGLNTLHNQRQNPQQNPALQGRRIPPHVAAALVDEEFDAQRSDLLKQAQNIGQIEGHEVYRLPTQEILAPSTQPIVEEKPKSSNNPRFVRQSR